MTIRVYSIMVENKAEACRVIAAVGADAAGCGWMAPKAVHRLVMLDGVQPKQANIIKQEMLGKGGEAAVSRGVVDNSVAETKVMLMGTLKQYEYFLAKLKCQPFGLANLAIRIREVLDGQEGFCPYDLDCRGKSIRLGEKTLVMGILNVTPDSFSDGGKYQEIDKALAHAWQMVEDGADIIDVGGESTRPGYTVIPEEEELNRVMPVLEKLAQELPVPISLDTSKALVAEEALAAGIQIVNDEGCGKDPRMAEVIGRFKAPVILMHNPENAGYSDIIPDLLESLDKQISMFEAAGVSPEKIMIDPGIGFGKTQSENLLVLKRLESLRTLGKPVLLGVSRKSFLGKVLDLPVEERLEGSLAAAAWGALHGAEILRVHDVRETVRLVKVLDAIKAEKE